MRIILFIGFSCMVLSCSDIKPQEVSEYFSMEKLLDEQVQLLSEKGSFILEKVAITADDTSKIELRPDSTQWKNELTVFGTFDINKPALIGQYDVSEKPDTKSNLTVRSYMAKSEDLRVQSFKIFFLDKPEKLKKMEANMSEENAVFNSSKNMRLTFDQINDETIIKSYSIEGSQKMILQDSTYYSIRGAVNF